MNQVKSRQSLITSLVIPLGLGLIAGIIISGKTDLYAGMSRPALSPPPWVFPVVWTLLYLLMGLASYLVYNATGASQAEKCDALVMYGIQLAVNLCWPILFFSLEMAFLALLVLLLLWILVYDTLQKFLRISKPAGLLLIPYLIWCSFALYLNTGIVFLS